MTKLKIIQYINDRVYAPVSNYYGSPFVFKDKSSNLHYICVEDEGQPLGEEPREVSEKFYKAFSEEFGNE